MGTLVTDDLFVLPPSALAYAKSRPPRIRGHAALPGSGSTGETCKTCAHLARVEMASTYLKCGLSRARWTGGPGTDVRAKDPACSKWVRFEKE